MVANPQTNHDLPKAVQFLGGYDGLARACGVSRSIVWRWCKRGWLPRTEWTGETNYAEKIEAATGGRITKAALLSHVPHKKSST